MRAPVHCARSSNTPENERGRGFRRGPLLLWIEGGDAPGSAKGVEHGAHGLVGALVDSSEHGHALDALVHPDDLLH